MKLWITLFWTLHFALANPATAATRADELNLYCGDSLVNFDMNWAKSDKAYFYFAGKTSPITGNAKAHIVEGENGQFHANFSFGEVVLTDSDGSWSAVLNNNDGTTHSFGTCDVIPN